MKLTVLGSSSKGNCYVLSTPTGSLLIEAGIPIGDIKKGLDFDLSKVLACLVTHEHKDHSKAVLDVMKSGIDCYLSKGTIEALKIPNGSRYRAIEATLGLQINFGDFTVLSFETEHDNLDSRGFIIKYRPTGEKLLFATDTYYLKNRFQGLNYIMIESNYILDTLNANVEAGYVDEAMKKRLLESHMSLEHCKEFLKANDLSQCRRIILLHLSDGNSDAKRMVKEIEALTGIETVIADAGLELDLKMYPY